MYNVNEIKKFIHEREKGRLLIYEDVLAKCFHRIQNAVQRDEPFALFIVPEFIIGKPKYNFTNCIQYIIFRLKQNGFDVKYYYPNALQIRWGIRDFQTFLSIEKDKGTFDSLAIENKPSSGPALFDLKTPHSGDKLGILNQKPKKQKTTLNLFEEPKNGDDISFKFRDPNKVDKKKMIETEKFKAINEFVPRKEVFGSFQKKDETKSIKSIKSNSFKRFNFL